MDDVSQGWNWCCQALGSCSAGQAGHVGGMVADTAGAQQ